MLNICFSGSAGGMMRFFREEFGVARTSIIGIDLFLHCGDISDPFDYETRREVFEADYNDFAKEIFDDNISGFQKKISKVKNACIWFSRNLPDEYLGYLYLVYCMKEKYNLYYCDCSDMPGSLCMLNDKECPPYIPDRVRLSAEEAEQISIQWQKIRYKNGNLRMVDNGEIISLKYNTFDDKFYSELSTEPRRAANVIKDIYFKNFYEQKLYSFVLVRLHQLIKEGKIIEVEKGIDNLYGEYSFMESRICLP